MLGFKSLKKISKTKQTNREKRKTHTTQLEKHMKVANEDFLVILWCLWKV